MSYFKKNADEYLQEILVILYEKRKPISKELRELNKTINYLTEMYKELRSKKHEEKGTELEETEE